MATNTSEQPRRVGRYLLFGPIASGGMATVHLGRLVGEGGFSRTVAIKRLHPQLADAPEIAAGLLDEARIVSRIRHPNVVPTLDLLTEGEEVLLVMEYVHGESLSRLLARGRALGEPAPIPIVASVICGALHGLHAAHEARSEEGAPLGIVHRDVSPENLLVGADGATRLLDFGIAKAHGRLTTTRNGQLKGKIAYMAPEQLLCAEVTRRTDIYAAGIVLWEALTGSRLFQGEDEAAVMTAAIEAPILPPSTVAAHVPGEIDAIVLRALDRRADDRFSTALELAIAVEEALPLASAREVGAWVERLSGPALARRQARIARMESASTTVATPAIEAREESDPARFRASRAGANDVATRTDVGVARPSAPARSRHEELTPIAAPAHKAPPRWLVAAGAAALLGGAAAAWLRAAPQQPLSPPPAGAAASAPVVESAPVASAAPPSVPVESASARTEAAPSPAPAPRAIVAGPAQRARPPAAASKTCNPPYTVDTNGVRHLRPECI